MIPITNFIGTRVGVGYRLLSGWDKNSSPGEKYHRTRRPRLVVSCPSPAIGGVSQEDREAAKIVYDQLGRGRAGAGVVGIESLSPDFVWTIRPKVEAPAQGWVKRARMRVRQARIRERNERALTAEPKWGYDDMLTRSGIFPIEPLPFPVNWLEPESERWWVWPQRHGPQR